MNNDSEDERDLGSRRVTGGESDGRLRALTSKRTLHDGAYGCTPPKRQHQDTASSYTHAEKSEKQREFVRRHYGHDKEEAEEAVDPQAKDSQDSDMASYSQTRKTLFEGEKIGEELFTEALDHAIDEAKDDDITELTDHMDRQQLEIGFQHMIQRMKSLKEVKDESTQKQSCKSSSSDSQLLQSSHEKRSRITPTCPISGKRHSSKVPIGTSGHTSPPGSKKTYMSKFDLPKLTPQEHTPKPPGSKAADNEPSKDDKPRKPAAKLESYAGQGASLESFLAKFESHAKYFGWSEQDSVPAEKQSNRYSCSDTVHRW